MLSLSEDNQSGVIEAFNFTSRYLDDILSIDNNFFDSMVNRIYSSELFWIYIYLYRMVLSRLKVMIKEMILVLIL